MTKDQLDQIRFYLVVASFVLLGVSLFKRWSKQRNPQTLWTGTADPDLYTVSEANAGYTS